MDHAFFYTPADDNGRGDKGPLDHAVVLYTDLNENSTRYDQLVSAPSWNQQELMWMAWACLTLLCTVTILVVFLAILSSPIRKKTFNVYLLCLMVPDMLFSALCCFTCLNNYRLGYYSSAYMCEFQAFYSVFSIASNGWLNAVICKQVHNMLVCVKTKNTYYPPPPRLVLGHAALVYLWALFVASWHLIGVALENVGIQFWPHEAALISGAACLPMDVDTESTIFFYCVFFPALLGIPLAYTFYLMIDIWRNDLLPPRGKRRQLTVFFLRLIMVFLLMWVPAILLIYIAGQVLGPWSKWFGGSWCHLQGAVSAAASLYKPDVFQAVVNFVTCSCSANKKLEEKREAKRQSNLVAKYTKELEQIEKELQCAQEKASSRYAKELEEVAKELHNTKETVEKEAAPLEVGLLEEFGDNTQTKASVNDFSVSRITTGIPPMTLEFLEKASSSSVGRGSRAPSESIGEISQLTITNKEEDDSSDSKCSVEAFATKELEPDGVETRVRPSNSDHLLEALWLNSDDDSEVIDFAGDAEEGLFKQAWKEWNQPAPMECALPIKKTSSIEQVEEYDC